ncbi:MAG: HNH endonuclease [Polyangiaceae bacterium]
MPFAGAGEQLAEAHDFVGRGTAAAQRGKAVGLIVGGLYSMVSGTGGEILGGAETATGVGAPVGAATIAVSTTMVVGGAANVLVGVQSLMAAPKGTGPSVQPTKSETTGSGARGGQRAGKAFTPRAKAQIDAENAARNGGANACENCGTKVTPGERSQRGVKPPLNERQRDHIFPRSKGGDGDPSNGQILCRDCNLNKSDKLP